MMNTEQCWRIEKDDVLTTLASMGNDSFDGLFMDSPYGLTFMEKKWDEALPSVDVCRELLRVAKPGAMLLAFGSPRTYHRLACHLEDAGWQIRDCLMWLYGEGMPKSHNIGKGIDKKLGAKRKVVGRNENSRERSTKRNTLYQSGMAGKTANITVPATPEAALWDGYGTALKPAWEPILFAMKPREGTFATNALKWGCGGVNIDACRVGTDGGTARSQQAPYPRKPDGSEDRSRCWARTGHGVEPIAASVSSNAKGIDHPAQFPLALVEPIIKTFSPVGGTVLDPFAGSGTTLLAAANQGRAWYGFDIDAEYCDLAR
jgi:site-specific DNA-methyltransferase (adenine-specific)